MFTLFDVKKAAIRTTAGMVALTAASFSFAATIETKYGDVEVEAAPKRVVTLYEGALDVTTALDIEALGAVKTRGRTGVAPYIKDSVPNISMVGTSKETNLEAVIALNPDVILASPRMSKEQFALLSSVAPTIVPKVVRYQPNSWKEESMVYAKALHQEAKMAEVISQVEQKAAGVKAKLANLQQTHGNTAVLARWVPQGAMVMSEGLFAATVIASAGFEMQDAGIVKAGRPHSSAVSQEKLSLIDADWLFIATLNEDAEKALAAAQTSEAFKRLNVVQNQRTFAVEGTLWNSASGPIAAETLLDQLSALMDGYVQ